jgi:hypothetical protein
MQSLQADDGAPPGTGVPMTESHLSTEDVAAYIDHRLPPSERRRAEAHMVACDDCRSELAQAAQLVTGAPAVGTGTSRRTVTIAGLAAAAVVVLAVSLSLPGRKPSPSSTQRATSDAEANVVRALAPAAGATVSSPAQAFVWHREGDARYQLRIVDSTGSPVWTTTTNDTSARLPATLRLPPQSRYFWYVDALRSDGVSMSSGPRPFGTP